MCRRLDYYSQYRMPTIRLTSPTGIYAHKEKIEILYLLCVLYVYGILTANVVCVLTSKTGTVVGKYGSRAPREI